jgi:transcription initiation factor TFIID subunit TAF12
LYNWKFHNYYCKLHERNLFLAQTLKKFCYKLNLAQNAKFYLQKMQNFLSWKNKQNAIEMVKRLAINNFLKQEAFLMQIKLFQFFAQIKNKNISTLKYMNSRKLIQKYQNEKENFMKK